MEQGGGYLCGAVRHRVTGPPQATSPDIRTCLIWTEERLSWMTAHPALPQFAQFSTPSPDPEG